MIRSARVVAAAALMLCLAQGDLTAQEKWIGFGGGATVPVGDYADFAKTGWMGGAAFGVALGEKGAFLEFVGFYGRNDYDDTSGDVTALYGGTANVGLMSRGEAARVYGSVGGGFQVHHYSPGSSTGGGSDNDGQPMANAAVGVSFGRGTTHFFVQGGIVIAGTKYIPLIAGVSIGLR